MSSKEFKNLAREIEGEHGSVSSLLLLTIVSLILVLFLWAAVTELDNVTRGNGKVISAAQNQLVQSSEPGVLRSRHVDEGDIVKKGDLLYDIDPVDATSQLDQAKQRYSTLSIKSIRLKAEVEGIIPNFPDLYIESSPEIIRTELALFSARREELETKLSILQQRKLQRINEVDELRIQIETTVNELNLIKQEINTIAPLVQTGLAPETRLITLRRDEEAGLGKIEAAKSAQIRLRSGIDEVDEQFNAEKQAYLTRSLTELSNVEAEVDELSTRIPALEKRVERTSIRSPVDGVINRLNYVTADAYVSTGDILLEIVPTGSDLIVEAKIDPKDIADIVLGQDVKIAFTAYDPVRYGRVDGKVINISADAVTDQNSGSQFYSVDVSIDGTLYEDNGAQVTFLPGMIASLDVLSGKRTILQYFWAPISRTKDRALRD